MPTDDPPNPKAMQAVARLYHAYMTGLMLTLVSRRSAGDAAEWVFRVFRHQHHEKFLSSFEKLGLKGMPDAVACAAYHYLSNSVGGVSVEFMRESDKKAWVRFVPPRWIYPGAAICGIPSEVSRAMLRGWYAQNGVSLGNPRLGFVCTAQTTDGQHGLAGYFLEHDHDLAPEERLQFRPGELPPPFDASAAPKLPAADWPPERLAKAERNYTMEYIRSGLPRLVELFGPAEAAHLGRTTGRLIGAQLYRETAELLGITGSSANAFGCWMQGIAVGEGDAATVISTVVHNGDFSEPDVFLKGPRPPLFSSGDGAGRGGAGGGSGSGGDGGGSDSAPQSPEPSRDPGYAMVFRENWRLMRGLGPLSPAIFEAWNGLHEGALAVHNRFLVLETPERLDLGDKQFAWKIRAMRG